LFRFGEVMFRPLHVLLVPFLLFQLAAQDQGLRVLIVDGDGEIVNIRQRNAAPASIEVQDAAGKDVAGATVVFFMPASGPGGTFSNGTNTLTAKTDATGRAVAYGMHPNNQTGVFTIRVAASYQGQSGNATITRTNVTGASSSAGSGGGGGGGFGTKAWIILGVCAGAVAGAVLYATHQGGGKSGNTGIVITPGTPTVGAPQ
jgi:hypothetical protein